MDVPGANVGNYIPWAMTEDSLFQLFNYSIHRWSGIRLT